MFNLFESYNDLIWKYLEYKKSKTIEKLNGLIENVAINTSFRTDQYTFVVHKERYGGPYFKCFKGNKASVEFPMVRLHFIKPEVIKQHDPTPGRINGKNWTNISNKDLDKIYVVLNSPVPKKALKTAQDIAALQPGVPTVYQCLVVMFNRDNFAIPYDKGYTITVESNPDKLNIPSYNWDVPHYSHPELDTERLIELEKLSKEEHVSIGRKQV